eukprot:tig00020510_g9805.t1
MAAFLPAPLPPARASAPTAPSSSLRRSRSAAPPALIAPALVPLAIGPAAHSVPGGGDRPQRGDRPELFRGRGIPARLLSRGRPAAAGQGARFEFAVRAELGGPDVDSPLPPAPTGSDAPVSGGSNGAGAASPARKPDAPGGQAAGLACPLPSPSAEAGAAKQTEPTADREQQPFEWRKNWYPVAFVEDFPRGRPYPSPSSTSPSSSGPGGRGGALRAGPVPAPRGAALGRAPRGALLECGYHGWQFDGSGRCARIPQLEAGAAINQRRACVAAYPVALAQGIIFVWADPKSPPTSPSSPASVRPEL